MEYQSAIKNNKTLPFTAAWLELEDAMVTEQVGHS